MTTISATARAAREHSREDSGRFGEQHLADPGSNMLAAPSDDRPTVEDLHSTRHPAHKAFAAAARAAKKPTQPSRRNPFPLNEYTALTLDDGNVYATDGYIMLRIQSPVADGCHNVGVDAAEAKRLSAATKGEHSPGVRLGDGNDTWLEIGGEPVHAAPGNVPVATLRRILGKFQADWEDVATPGIPENWQDTRGLLNQLRDASDTVQYGNSQYDARRVERAVRAFNDLGVKQVLIQTQSQHWPGEGSHGRVMSAQIRITGAGIEALVMGQMDRSIR